MFCIYRPNYAAIIYPLIFDSLQYRRILDVQVYIFVLGCYLGFGNWCEEIFPEIGGIELKKMGWGEWEGKENYVLFLPPTPLLSAPILYR